MTTKPKTLAELDREFSKLQDKVARAYGTPAHMPALLELQACAHARIAHLEISPINSGLTCDVLGCRENVAQGEFVCAGHKASAT